MRKNPSSRHKQKIGMIISQKLQAENAYEYFKSIMEEGFEVDHQDVAREMEIINWCDRELLRCGYEREFRLMNALNESARNAINDEYQFLSL